MMKKNYYLGMIVLSLLLVFACSAPTTSGVGSGGASVSLGSQEFTYPIWWVEDNTRGASPTVVVFAEDGKVYTRSSYTPATDGGRLTVTGTWSYDNSTKALTVSQPDKIKLGLDSNGAWDGTVSMNSKKLMRGTQDFTKEMVVGRWFTSGETTGIQARINIYNTNGDRDTKNVSLMGAMVLKENGKIDGAAGYDRATVDILLAKKVPSPDIGVTWSISPLGDTVDFVGYGYGPDVFFTSAYDLKNHGQILLSFRTNGPTLLYAENENDATSLSVESMDNIAFLPYGAVHKSR